MSSLIQHRSACQTEVTEARALLIHKALKGDINALKEVRSDEIKELKYEKDFADFLEVNRDKLALVCKGAV